MKLADLLLRLQQLPPDAHVVARDFSGYQYALRELHFQRAPGPEIQLRLGNQYVPWDGINSELIDVPAARAGALHAAAAAPVALPFMAWRTKLAELVDAYIQGESDGEGAGDEAYKELKAHILATPFTVPPQPLQLEDEHGLLAGPATGMKPDACADRNQCLEACGPLGQIPPATCTVHLPNGLVHACERHASVARLQASFLGTHAHVDQAPAGATCTYCAALPG